MGITRILQRNQRRKSLETITRPPHPLYVESIGRTIVCDDGVPRRVVEIVPSHRYRHMAIINENDPDSKLGYFVHLLSLVHQLEGKGVPSQEQMDAATRLWSKIDMARASELESRIIGPQSKLKLELD